MTLPAGWRDTILRDICVSVPNYDPTRSPDKEFEYVDIGSIDNTRGRIVDTKKFLGKDAPSRARRPIQTDDVLFSNVRTYLMNIARITNDISAGLCSTGFTVLRPSVEVDSRYLYYYVRSDAFVLAVTPEQTGTHYPATSDRVVLGQSISLPPTVEEQRRIAAKLDHIAARLDDAKARLDSIPTILKRFRMSVLAAACSGRLTADWRKARGEDSDSVGIAAGSNFDLPELPATWRYPNLGEIINSLKYGTSTRCTYEKIGKPVLRIPNIGEDGQVNADDLKFGELPDREYHQLALEVGDLLLIRSNGSVSLVGRTALVSGECQGYAYAGYLIRLRPNKEKVLSAYLNRVMASPAMRLQIEVPARSTSGVNNINSTEVGNLLAPLPPMEEQAEIVRRVEALFKQADAIEVRYRKAKVFTDKLMPAVLAKAFRGELV